MSGCDGSKSSRSCSAIGTLGAMTRVRLERKAKGVMVMHPDLPQPTGVNLIRVLLATASLLVPVGAETRQWGIDPNCDKACGAYRFEYSWHRECDSCHPNGCGGTCHVTRCNMAYSDVAGPCQGGLLDTYNDRCTAVSDSPSADFEHICY